MHALKFLTHRGHGVREYETKSTRAWFVTTGYLVRVMANNMESLRDVSHLIIDEGRRDFPIQNLRRRFFSHFS